VLAGKRGPARDIVLLNAGAAFVVADRAADMPEGIVMAAESIDSGAATEALAKLIAVSKT